MDANRPGKSSAPRVFLFRLLLILLLLTSALGALVWRAPTWVSAKLTRFRLYAEGFRSHTALLNGSHVVYIEGGPAAANVVLIHGLGTEAEEDWAVLAPYLVRAGHHVYAMDLLGYGRSDKPTEMSYSISEEAKFVESFLEANRLTSVSLAGVSMGGWIAAAVALDKPS
jgi:pimeloyl-ACP methyl ester carboxylesterase